MPKAPTTNKLSRAALAAILAAGAIFSACDDGNLPSDSTSASSGATTTIGSGGSGGQGGATGGSGGTGGATDCFASPRTHVEIINACTAAEQIDKQPVLPLLNPDGSLPSLP